MFSSRGASLVAVCEVSRDDVLEIFASQFSSSETLLFCCICVIFVMFEYHNSTTLQPLMPNTIDPCMAHLA